MIDMQTTCYHSSVTVGLQLNPCHASHLHFAARKGAILQEAKSMMQRASLEVTYASKSLYTSLLYIIIHTLCIGMLNCHNILYTMYVHNACIHNYSYV